ncbi:TonB-dependent receptor, partial [Rhodothalassium salexigens]
MVRKSTVSLAALAALTGTFGSTAAYGQVEEIVVTATKRVQTTQDAPVTVTALGSAQLEDLRISNFTDYLQQLPNVTAQGRGPGQQLITVRGLGSSAFPVYLSGANGKTPNVALYLDEQPVTMPGRNLDVYATDLERIEVLPGPQGTLFGAS